MGWRVENASSATYGYVGVPATAPSARIVFDDGSDVILEPGSRGRVAETTATGAEVVLEQGRAHVHVRHLERTRWLFHAGPFVLRVTGTEFYVAWASDAEMLDVWMQSGQVVATGAVLGESLTLSGGQHVRARLGDGTVQIDREKELSQPVAQGPSIAPAPPEPEPTHNEDTEASRLAPSPKPAGVSWGKLVVSGDYARVVREAHGDLAHALASRSAGELRALGDAARYENDPELADRAYLALRARFPATGESKAAAFLLGRVAEEQRFATDEALRWYDTYIKENPSGPFAGDALGRKMLLVAKSQGRDAARNLAQTYLGRYPSGPYAVRARDLSP
jgi:hypothetical protein